MNPERETIVDSHHLKQHPSQGKGQEEEETKLNIQQILKLTSDIKNTQEKIEIEVLTLDEKNRLISDLKVTLKKCIDITEDASIMIFEIISDKDNEKMRILFTRLTNMLATLKGQLSFISEFLTISSQLPLSTEAIEELATKYVFLGAFSVPAKTLEDVCFETLGSTLNFLLHVRLSDLITAIHDLFQKEKGYKVNEIIDTLQIIVGKVETVIDYIPYSVCFGKEDLFALDKKSPRWGTLHKLINFKDLGPATQISKSYRKFCKSLILASAALSKSRKQDTEIMQNIVGVYSTLYYMVNEDEANKEADLFIAAPEMKTTFKVYNLLETKFLREALEVILPLIKYKQKIYISRGAPKLTFKKIQDQFTQGTINKITPDWLNNEDEEELKARTKAMHSNRNKEELLKSDKSKISLRILCHKKLANIITCPLDSTRVPRKPNLVEKMLGIDYDPNDPTYDGLIVHIHGGGFVAMSSKSHQTYTRRWANLIKKPIFSLDYRLAPDNTYPDGLDDCWQVYNWIVDNAEDILGVKPKKILIAGDSAGGNLALALALLAIKSGKRVPDGLLLVYPALNLNPRRFTPSYLLALDDPLLNYTFLKLCISAYLPEGADPDNDPFLSPILASPEFLEKLPPIRLMVGTKDPLHDESWRFIDKVQKYQTNIKMNVYSEFPHGFLNYDIPGQGMVEARVTVDDAVGFLGELFAL